MGALELCDRKIGRHYYLQLERLIAVVQQISPARSLDRITEIVCHEARALTGADGATFVLQEAGSCNYVDEEAISPLWKGKHFPIDDCISGWVMKHGQPIVIEDIYADPRIPSDAFRPTFASRACSWCRSGHLD